MNNIDLNIRKLWRLNEKGATVEVRGESFNAFNRPQFGAPTTDQFSTAFGQITATRNYARQVQLVARFNF